MPVRSRVGIALALCGCCTLVLIGLLCAGCGGAKERDPRTLARQLASADRDGMVRAAVQLVALGAKAEPALPEMMRLLEKPESSWTAADQVVRSIGRIGPKASDAVPLLVKYMQTSPTSYGPSYAALALGKVHSAPNVAVPALIDALRNPRITRDSVARSLAAFGERAAPAVPVVIALLKSEGKDMKEWEITSLLTVLEAAGPLASEAVPTLAALVSDETRGAELRIGAARALGSIGKEASGALPALRSVIEQEPGDPHSELAVSVQEAILSIEGKSGGR